MLNEDQQLIRESTRKFAEDFLKPNTAHWAKTHTFPTSALKEMANIGLMGMLVPEQYNGSNIGHVAYALAIEEIAAGDASTSTILSVHNGLVCGAILNYGTKAQQELFLRPLATGEKLGAFCLTEPEAGSDAANIKTRAEKSGAESLNAETNADTTVKNYVLNGTKQFITSGKHADLALVFAVTDPSLGKKGISAFLVPTHLPGYVVARVEEKMGQEAAITVQLNFDDLKIPIENRLGQEGEGYKIALSQLESGRIGIAAQCIGIAKAALEAAINFAKERVTFGKPIFKHQAVSFQLAEMATQIEAARQLMIHAAELKDAKIPCLKEASMAKLFASEMAEKVCRMAIQIHGGYGYMAEFPVERLYRDVRACTLYEGTSEIQKILISRELLEEK